RAGFLGRNQSVSPGHCNYRLCLRVVKPRRGEKMEERPDGERGWSAPEEVNHVLDLQLEQQQQGQALSDLYEGVLTLKRRYGLHEVLVRPRDSLAVRRDGEREQVHELVKRYRDVPGEQQRRLPALLNSLGQLEV